MVLYDESSKRLSLALNGTIVALEPVISVKRSGNPLCELTLENGGAQDERSQIEVCSYCVLTVAEQQRRSHSLSHAITRKSQ